MSDDFRDNPLMDIEDRDLDIGEAGITEAELNDSISFHIPAGRQTLIFLPTGDGITYGSSRTKDPETQAVIFADGREGFFTSLMVNVALCLPGDPSRFVRDSFWLPPRDPEHSRAYWQGYAKGKPLDRFHHAFASRKFMNFVRGMGMPWEKGQPIPVALKNTRNWRLLPNGEARTISALVIQEEYKAERGPNAGKMMTSSKVKLFAYEATPESLAFAGSNGTAPAASPASGQAASAPAVAVVDDGLNDI